MKEIVDLRVLIAEELMMKQEAEYIETSTTKTSEIEKQTKVSKRFNIFFTSIFPIPTRTHYLNHQRDKERKSNSQTVTSILNK